jgi:hypothetical protein
MPKSIGLHRLFRRDRLTMVRATLSATMLAVVVVLGCGSGSGSSGAGGTGDGDGDGDGDYYDGVPCDLGGGCTVAADCCVGHLGSNHFGAELDCPGSTYPNRWRCSQPSNSCVNLGCLPNLDECGPEPFECHYVDMDGVPVGFCFLPCDDNADCEDLNAMNATECSGEAIDGTRFCLEPVQ